VPRVEDVPGRRSAEQPARARAGTAVDDRPEPLTAPDPRPRRVATVAGLVWLLLVGAAAGGLVALRATDGARWEQQSLAAAIGVLLALGLAVRSGGPALASALLGAALGTAAVLTQWPPLLAGAAVGTGVLAACLAVLGTTPASSPRLVVREVVLAQLLATVGAIGVVGWGAALDTTRFGYTVLALSLAATTAMVHRLGGGLQGLGRRGRVIGLVVLVVLVLALAYSEALARWGSPGLIEQLDAFRLGMRDRLGAVPHPIEVLLGIPALAWGVFMRGRRRQGWWLLAFGTAATAPATTRLLEVATPLNTLLAAAYSVVLGLLLGWLLIRGEQRMRGSRGRRARRGEEAAAHRPEPGRLHPLR
jgi:hypothetical protein